MNEDLKATEFLFTKMKKLYPTFTRPDEVDVLAWTEILEGYSQTDILEALKNYRKNVAYNVAPLPAKFKEYLPEKHTKTATPNETKELPTGYFYWKQDGGEHNLKYFLPDYEYAFNLCITTYLQEVIPADVYENASWVRRIRLALENGVLNRMQEALQTICPKPRYLSDNEYYTLHNKPHKVKQNADLSSIKSLSAHWRTV